MLLVASVVSLLSVGHAFADEGFEIDRTQRFQKLDPADSLLIDNPWGDVHLRFGGYEPRVEVMATLQNLEPGSPWLEMKLDRAADVADRVDARVGFGEKTGKGRADIVVFVPQNIPVEVRTTTGNVAAKGVESPIRVATTNGNVTIRKPKGPIDVETERGEILVHLKSGIEKRSQQFRTLTGDVTLFIPENADYDVRLATSGEISTDFSIDIEHRRTEEPGKIGVATIGSGGAPVSIESRRGHVRLFRQLVSMAELEEEEKEEGN